jgi:hypothetical protein
MRSANPGVVSITINRTVMAREPRPKLVPRAALSRSVETADE